MDEAPILGGGRVRKTLSPYVVGGDTVYTAQEDLKSINTYNMGEGKMVRGLVLPFLCFLSILRPSLVLSILLSLGHHIPSSLFLGPVLWPLLIPCSCLTIYPFPFSHIWESSVKEKEVMTALASSG